MANQRIAIFGATSEIGEETAQLLVAGNDLLLAGRRTDALEEFASRLRVRGARSVRVFYFDATDITSHRPLIDEMESTVGPIDVAFAMFGVLGNQELAEQDGHEVHRILHTDFTAQAVLLTELAARMKQRPRTSKKQTRGTIVAFSSIAGARVRRPNYVYGSGKAGLDGFAQGMQDALQGTGVRLMIVRPGFVIGRMTEGMDPAPMSSTAVQVAKATVEALDGRQSDVWIPGKLKFLAAIMQFVPRWLWRRAPR